MTKQTHEPIESNGQAGALTPAFSKDAGGLRFETPDDSQRYFRDLAKKGTRRFSAYDRGVSDSWHCADVDLVVTLCLSGSSQIYEFSFRSVPFGDHGDASAIENAVADRLLRDVKFELNKTSMILDVAQLVECPEGPVAAFLVVRTYVDKGLVNFNGDTANDARFGFPSFLDVVLHPLEGVGEGELGSDGVLVAQSNRRVENRMVEGRSERVDDVVGDDRDPDRDRSCDPHPVQLLAGIRVRLDEAFAYAVFDKRVEPSVHFIDVFQRTIN